MTLHAHQSKLGMALVIDNGVYQYGGGKMSIEYQRLAAMQRLDGVGLGIEARERAPEVPGSVLLCKLSSKTRRKFMHGVSVWPL